MDLKKVINSVKPISDSLLSDVIKTSRDSTESEIVETITELAETYNASVDVILKMADVIKDLEIQKAILIRQLNGKI